MGCISSLSVGISLDVFLKFWLVLVLIESIISVRFQNELKLGVPFSKLMGSFNRYVIVWKFLYEIKFWFGLLVRYITVISNVQVKKNRTPEAFPKCKVNKTLHQTMQWNMSVTLLNLNIFLIVVATSSKSLKVAKS